MVSPFLRSHTLCLLPHSRWRRLCSKASLGHLAGRRDQYPVARSRLQMVRTSASQIGESAAFADEEPRWSASFWPCGAVDGLPVRGDFHRTFTLPLMWSASLSVASQNFAYAPLRHLQHPGYFSLRIAICRQPDNSLQYLFWQILWHDPL